MFLGLQPEEFKIDSLILLSGGLDSTVLLGYLISLQKKCVAISFDYNQRHKQELEAAREIAAHYKIEHQIFHIDPKLFSSAASSLTNTSIEVELENTYVPARNLLFLSHAASFAESRNISEIYFGANADDTHLFPDCARAFFDALERAIRLGTKSDSPRCICTPFSELSKTKIIALGNELNVPLNLSFSCYDPKENMPCGVCQACVLRSKKS